MVDQTEQVEKFQDFIEQSYKKNLHEALKKGRKCIVIDFHELVGFDPDLAEELLNEPEETLKAAELSLDHFDVKDTLRIRLKNLPESQKIPISEIRSYHINKFITFACIVRQASEIRPQVVCAKFECPSCGTPMTILQISQKFREPSRCSCGRKGKFRLLSKDLVDAQRLVVEEAPEDLEGGAQPKRLSVFLKEDLVEPVMEKKTTPGNKICICGIIKELPVPLRTGGTSTRYDLIAEANYIEPVQEEFTEIEIAEEDIRDIKKLANDPKFYEKLVCSIAPSIYGHEKIKEALLLQLVGGVKKIKKDGTIIRGDMHCLLVGDPGSGKSNMLTFISKAAPKARYIAGTGASKAGLTASVVKDEFLKGWALEAGAIVLANKGVVVIDELDKISIEDTAALHEGMEQQQISIAKANIQATLRAETTVLAAANPKLGRFNPYGKGIAEQINLPPALINRFDLIFLIKDVPDKNRDRKIAKHILSLQQAPTELITEVSSGLLRKYIAYAKQKIVPKLSDSAREEIEEFYVKLRNTESSEEGGIKPIPISARQLEALVRLAEASAKIRLSSKVTKKDARRAIALLQHCLMQVGIDPETGQIDIDRISTGITASTRNKIVVVRTVIDSFERGGVKTIPVVKIITEAELKGLDERTVNEVLDRLKREGEIFEPKPGFLQRI